MDGMMRSIEEIVFGPEPKTVGECIDKAIKANNIALAAVGIAAVAQLAILVIQIWRG